jgi:nucleotide-binding universal stress UspA family protein
MLVCLTDSPHALAVVRGASSAAKAFGSQPIYLHVGNDAPATRRQLEGILSRSNAASGELLIRPGRPDDVICRAATELDIDLVFAGALERDGLVRELLGSTARRVARRASCSVFLSIDPQDGAAAWPRITAAIRLDDASANLLTRLAALARLSERPMLHVIHENAPRSATENAPTAAAALRDVEYKNLRSASENFELANFLEKLDLGGIQVKIASLSGRASGDTIRYARDVGSDLLALRAPSRPFGLWDRFFGHPAETALLALPCSLLIHRTRKPQG